jgi:hypothetical protein
MFSPVTGVTANPIPAGRSLEDGRATRDISRLSTSAASARRPPQLGWVILTYLPTIYGGLAVGERDH